MTRTIRTLKLSAVTLGVFAATALAANTAPLSASVAVGMPAMHATATAHPHAANSGMAHAHPVMMTNPAMHNAMLNDEAMLTHLAKYNLDVDHMRRLHDEGRSLDEIHASLEQQGIDINAMQVDCPMGSNDAMANLHSGAGHATHMAFIAPRGGEPK